MLVTKPNIKVGELNPYLRNMYTSEASSVVLYCSHDICLLPVSLLHLIITNRIGISKSFTMAVTVKV